MLGAVYIPPQSKAFPHAQVNDSFLALADELSRASQVAPHFLLCGDLNAGVSARPLMRLADNVQILPVKHISDHCTMSLRFLVEEAGLLSDWSLDAGHRCAPGGCGKCFALRWQPDRSTAYVAALEASVALQGQFEDANVEKDLEKACCLLRSLVVHAAGEPGVDMTRNLSMCAHLKRSRGAARNPPWFSDECAMLRRHFREVVRSGLAVHACKEACKLYRASVQQSKRAHSKHLKAAFTSCTRKRQTCFLCCAPPSAHTNPRFLNKRGRLT